MAKDKSANDDSYLMWTCGLMALIIVVLAVLWVQQNRRTRAAMQQLADVTANHERLKDSYRAAQLPLGSIPPPPPPGIAKSVVLDGEEVTALVVGPKTGISLGLRPGQVLIVTGHSPEEDISAPPVLMPGNIKMDTPYFEMDSPSE